ncbi:MAG: hypothetical protein PHU41_08655, partial [Sulfuricurvum sp.]|nr:hypothetical protein [Sulfuricurvum sp.]
MNKFFLLVLVISVSLQGATKLKEQKSVAVSQPIEISDEAYILAALDAQMRQKNDVAAGYFDTLYSKTGRKEYLYQSLRMVEKSNDTEKLTRLTQTALVVHPEDQTLLRFGIIALLKSGKYSQAAQESSALSEQTKAAADYALNAEALIKLGNFQGGYSALKKG